MRKRIRVVSDILNKKFKNTYGDEFTVISHDKVNYTIKFSDGLIRTNILRTNITNGYVKNPNHIHTSNSINPTVLKIGYLGVGKYTSKNNKYYIIWITMFQRCYNKQVQLKQPTYLGCTIDKIWHNFQNFAEWCEKNYVEGFQLDKDILIKGNKIYGPETCCFVPQEINKLFTKSNALRGNLPLGVSKDVHSKNKFKSQLNIHLGMFDTIEEAFQSYKEAKENWIQKTADLYKNKIDEKIFKALMNYQVEITD